MPTEGRSSTPHPSTITAVEIADAVEWGGPTWIGFVTQAIERMSPLDGLRILELGPRSGRMSCLFARHGATVVGVHFESASLVQATAEAQRAGVADRVRFLLDDGRLSSVADETFDVVFSKSVLVVVPDRTSYLDTIVDRLRPGGLLVGIENGIGGPPVRLARRLRRTAWDDRAIPYFEARDIDAIRARFDVELARYSRFPPVHLIVARKAV